jgi:hypothetical protein
MKTAIITAAAAIVTLLLVPACSYNYYVLNRDLDAYQGRAQVAADREDMLHYLGQYQENLRKHDATTGHAALIFKTPGNDLALNYETLTRIVQRLQALEGQPKSSTTYQVALDDIRGTLRELMRPAGGLIWVRWAWWVLLLLIALWLVAGIGLLYHLEQY